MNRRAYLDLLPILVVQLEHADVMLNGYNEAVSIDKLFILSAGNVRPIAECDDGCAGYIAVLIAEWTAV